MLKYTVVMLCSFSNFAVSKYKNFTVFVMKFIAPKNFKNINFKR